MTGIILNIVAFVVVLGLIILLHELGHFFVAKKANVLVHEYSIGMGPTLYQKRYKETNYSIRAILIGGYVSMAGESGAEELPIKIGDTVGINLDEAGLISQIILNKKIASEFQAEITNLKLFEGEIEDFFLELKVDNQIKNYKISEECTYVYKKKSQVQITPKSRLFDTQALWKKVLIIFAGPLMNFILAFLLFFIGYMIVGKPSENPIINLVDGPSAGILEVGDTLTEINGVQIDKWSDIATGTYKNIGYGIEIKYLSKDSNTQNSATIYPLYSVNILGFSGTANPSDLRPVVTTSYNKALEAGLKAGDIVRSINGNRIYTWQELYDFSKNVEGGEIVLEINRAGTLHELKYKVMSSTVYEGQGVSPMQITIGIGRNYHFDFVYALKMGVVDIGNNVKQIFSTLAALFTPKSGVSANDLSGPIGIFNIVGNVRTQGFTALILFTAFLSINIGLLNLLPIPALDGGRIIFLLIEALVMSIRRRGVKKQLNLSNRRLKAMKRNMVKEGKIRKHENVIDVSAPKLKKIEAYINLVFLMLLLALMVYVSVFDVIRLF